MSKPQRPTLAGLSENRHRAPEKPTQADEAPKAGKGQKEGGKPSRTGKSLIGGHFPPHVRQQVRKLAYEQDRTVQDLMSEALNLLFERHGENPIAPKDED